MTKQEALEKSKNYVRVADWIDENYVYRASKEVLKSRLKRWSEKFQLTPYRV